MKWHITPQAPAFRQLHDQLIIAIVSGTFKPGERLPSTNTLAKDAEVSPNTAQKALTSLRDSGLSIIKRTRGNYVTTDVDLIERTRSTLAENEAKAFIETMHRLRFDDNQIIGMISGGSTTLPCGLNDVVYIVHRFHSAPPCIEPMPYKSLLAKIDKLPFGGCEAYLTEQEAEAAIAGERNAKMATMLEQTRQGGRDHEN